MTRINCVPPEELVNEHLLAEYRELPRVFGLVKAAEARGITPTSLKAPEDYCLGEGHVTFFYDKLLYLSDRHREICEELKSRGYHLNHDNPHPALFEVSPGWLGEWSPTQEEMETSRARIRERLATMKEK